MTAATSECNGAMLATTRGAAAAWPNARASNAGSMANMEEPEGTGDPFIMVV
jgi:hypothetical protein